MNLRTSAGTTAPGRCGLSALHCATPGDGFKWSFRVGLSRERLPSVRGDEPNEWIRSPKAARIEAVLLVADAALSTRRLAQLATLTDAAEAKQLIDQLNEAYDLSGCAFRVERVATGYRLLTRPKFAFWLGRLHQRQAELKLTPPAMETLTIIAYRQPMTRADVEAVRGVQCAEMLKQLMERGLVRIAGEDDTLGRPFLYETTRKFLELFGLRSLDDLPMCESLRAKPRTSSGEEGTSEGAEQAA